MAYSKPPYVNIEEVGDPNLQYVWDDTRTSEDFEHDGEWLPEKVQGVHLTGQIALGIGIHEWIVWRFQPLLDEPQLLQLIEAAWCATVHPDYMFAADFDRDDWVGPIRGPLWCAQTWMVPMARANRDNPEECEDGLAYLYALAMHVLPTTTAFQLWLGSCVERITELYAAPEDDPFTGLFRDPKEGRGPLVAPPLLNLAEPYDPSTTRAYMITLMAAAQRASNPFLASPEEMREAGFTGTPFEVRDMDGV